MPSKNIQALIVKYITKQANPKEMALLLEWLNVPQNLSLFNEYVRVNYAIDFTMNKYDAEKTKKELIQEIRKDKGVFRKRRMGLAVRYAAVLVLAFGLGYIYHSTNTKEKMQLGEPTIVNNQIETGLDKAILTLENGEKIALTKGQVYETDQVSSDGETITYKEKITKEVVYNYLTVPRGGQFEMTLADGTKVSLNSETQLKYPVSFFKGQTRQVELIYGEAYFDVSPSTDHNGANFKMLHDLQNIEVLGTEFNVKAYKDEANVYTTLVEGKIALETPVASSERTILFPGQQSNLSMETNALSVATVEVYNQVAWRDGVFNFDKMPLKDMMKVLSRWYDMDVEFVNKEMEAVVLTGTFNKNRSIDELLLLIKNIDIINNFKINNKTVTIE